MTNMSDNQLQPDSRTGWNPVLGAAALTASGSEKPGIFWCYLCVIFHLLGGDWNHGILLWNFIVPYIGKNHHPN